MWHPCNRLHMDTNMLSKQLIVTNGSIESQTAVSSLLRLINVAY